VLNATAAVSGGGRHHRDLLQAGGVDALVSRREGPRERGKNHHPLFIGGPAHLAPQEAGLQGVTVKLLRPQTQIRGVRDPAVCRA